MFDLLMDIDLSKLTSKVNSKDLMAGILYKGDKPIKKILFSKKDDLAYDVFEDKCYKFLKSNDLYVSDCKNVSYLVENFIKKDQLNIYDLFKFYFLFMDSDVFIKSNLDYFDMCEKEVGYKFKTVIEEMYPGIPTFEKELYKTLKKIIETKYVSCKEKNKILYK